jgi:hypothetical protein
VRTFFKQEDYLPWPKIGVLALTGFFTFFATLVNPRGPKIWNYAYQLSSSIDIRDLNREWHPPSPNGFAMILFFASILLLIILLYYSRYRPTFTDLILILSFLWLAWSAIRHVIWYAIIVVPILVRLFKYLPIKSQSFSSQHNWLNLVILVILFVPAILIQPWWIEKSPLPDTYWDVVYKGKDIGPLVGKETPLEAVEYLREHPGGNLFHNGGYGSFLIWALPDQGVFVDARVELYSREQWDNYLNISNGIRYDELLAKYGVDRIMLDIKEQPELLLAMKSDPAWMVEYQNEMTIIWSKMGER